MRAKLKLMIALFLIIALYSNSFGSVNAEAVTANNMVGAVNNVQTIQKLSTKVYKPINVALGKKYVGDLNKDGKKDTVLYTASVSDDYEVKITLSINGKNFASKLEGLKVWIENPNLKSYYITDIDSSDKYKEIAILDEGPSSDPVTYYLRYDGKTIKYVGATPDFPMNDTYSYSGKGTITASGRLSILQTWFAPMKWELNDKGVLEIVSEKIYYPYDYTKGDSYFKENPIKLLENITIYASNSSKSKKTTLKKGTKINFTATDDKNWVKLKTSSGQQGWFYLENGYNMKIDGKEIFVSDIFTSLCMYD